MYRDTYIENTYREHILHREQPTFHIYEREKHILVTQSIKTQRNAKHKDYPQMRQNGIQRTSSHSIQCVRGKALYSAFVQKRYIESSWKSTICNAMRKDYLQMRQNNITSLIYKRAKHTLPTSRTGTTYITNFLFQYVMQ